MTNVTDSLPGDAQVHITCVDHLHASNLPHDTEGLVKGAYAVQVEYLGEEWTLAGWGYAKEGAEMGAQGLLHALEEVPPGLPKVLYFKGNAMKQRIGEDVSKRLLHDPQAKKKPPKELSNQQLWQDIRLMLESHEASYDFAEPTGETQKIVSLRETAKEYLRPHLQDTTERQAGIRERRGRVDIQAD
jgi:hypothetical protein